MATHIGAQLRGAQPSGWLPAIRAWTYRATSTRDQRLDLLRGFCLFAMIVNHVGGTSLLHVVSGGNAFYVSAAEGFVFISGLLIGMIYARIIAQEGFAAAALKVLRRARTLYVLMVALTMVFFYGGWAAGMWWADPVELSSPLSFLWNVMTFGRAFFITDILVLYTLLLAGAPLALWLLQRGWTALLLAGSWALWLGFQLSPELIGLSLLPIDTFHPAPWQIFFVHAMAIGYHRERLAALLTPRRKRAIVLASGVLFAVLLAIFLTQGALLRPILGDQAGSLLYAAMEKRAVRPGRIVAAAAVFPLLYALVSFLWQPIQRWLGWLLLPLGRNSLYSYTMHTMLIILSGLLIGDMASNTIGLLLEQTGVDVLAVIGVWLLVRRQVLFSVIPR